MNYKDPIQTAITCHDEMKSKTQEYVDILLNLISCDIEKNKFLTFQEHQWFAAEIINYNESENCSKENIFVINTVPLEFGRRRLCSEKLEKIDRYNFPNIKYKIDYDLVMSLIKELRKRGYELMYCTEKEILFVFFEIRFK